MANTTPSTALNLNPGNKNFLSPIPFQLAVQRLPNVDYFVQKVNLPGVSSSPATYPTMFTDIPLSGVKLKWNPLIVTFKVDENLNNWSEIFDWITAINEAKGFEGYNKLAQNPNYSGLNVTSEMILIVNTNERQAQKNVFFHDAFPISLSDMSFDSTKEDIEFITVTTTFMYSTYSLDPNV